MSEFYDPGGSQFDLAATTLTDLYTCPDGQTVKLAVTMCNRTGGIISIRIAVARNGAADDVKQYILYDYELAAKNVYVVEDLTINQTDVVRVRTSATGISAGVYIEEVRTLAT